MGAADVRSKRTGTFTFPGTMINGEKEYRGHELYVNLPTGRRHFSDFEISL